MANIDINVKHLVETKDTSQRDSTKVLVNAVNSNTSTIKDLALMLNNSHNTTNKLTEKISQLMQAMAKNNFYNKSSNANKDPFKTQTIPVYAPKSPNESIDDKAREIPSLLQNNNHKQEVKEEVKERENLNRQLKSNTTNLRLFGSVLGMAAFPVLNLFSQMNKNQAMIAGNDLSDAQGFTQNQLQNLYDQRKTGASALTTAVGAAAGGIIGGIPGALIGGGIGGKIGDIGYDLWKAKEFAAEQLKAKIGDTVSQLGSRNQTGVVGASVYQRMFTDPSLSRYANQIPYMYGANAYRALNQSEYIGIASLAHGQGVSGGATNQLASSIAQIIPYFANSETALNALNNNFTTYSGDILSQTAQMVSLLQQGVNVQDAQRIAFKGGYQGEDAQRRMAAYATSPVSQRLQQELSANLLGFSVAAYMSGTESSSQIKSRLRNAGIARPRVGAGANELLGATVVGALFEQSGAPYAPTNNVMPRIRGYGDRNTPSESTQQRALEELTGNTPLKNLDTALKNSPAGLPGAKYAKSNGELFDKIYSTIPDQKYFDDHAKEIELQAEYYLKNKRQQSLPASESLENHLKDAGKNIHDAGMKKQLADLTRQIEQLNKTLHKVNR